MIRQTSIEAYNTIKDNGLLSERRWQVYNVLFHHGPLTATQIASKIPGIKSASVGNNSHARLGELRQMGCVVETGYVECPLSGMTVIRWDVTDKVPVKFERPSRVKCTHCSGKGYIETQQTKLF